MKNKGKSSWCSCSRSFILYFFLLLTFICCIAFQIVAMEWFEYLMLIKVKKASGDREGFSLNMDLGSHFVGRERA